MQKPQMGSAFCSLFNLENFIKEIYMQAKYR